MCFFMFGIVIVSIQASSQIRMKTLAAIFVVVVVVVAVIVVVAVVDTDVSGGDDVLVLRVVCCKLECFT